MMTTNQQDNSTFTYSTGFPAVDPKRRDDLQAPLFPDFDPHSPAAQRLFKAKNDNGPEFWSEMRAIFKYDFETLPLERFKAWASVWVVPIMSRSRLSSLIARAIELCERDEIYLNAVKEPRIGLNANDFAALSVVDDIPTTMNRLQHLAHLATCDFSAETLSGYNSIVELGGGVGDMADIICKLGFKGKYTLYDFEEVGAIQKWYHTQLGHTNIVHTSNVDDLAPADLCIATWSFTEMPLDLRQQIVDRIGTTSNWLIAFSNEIFGINNADYINNTFIPLFINHDVKLIDVPSMNWDGGTKYLVIKKRK